MKIALAQLNFTVGDIKANTTKIIAAINEAKQQGADLAVFAEFAVSGTPAYGLLTRQHSSHSARRLSRISLATARVSQRLWVLPTSLPRVPSVLRHT